MGRHFVRTVLFAGSLCLAGAARSQAPAPPAPQCTFEGRAVDDDGKPVAGAAVAVFPLGHWFDTAACLGKPVATTGDDGGYRVPGPVAQYLQVVVMAPGRQVCALRVAAAPDLARKLPDALLLRGETLRGRVRDERGAPLAGARIQVEDAITNRGIEPLQLRSGALSDAKGIFAVPGVPRTGLRVTVSAPGHLTVSQLAAHQSPLDVTLQPTGLVRGRVVDATGGPVAGIAMHTITVERREGDLVPVHSDADGRFELTVPTRGRFRVGGSEGAPLFRQYSSGLLHGPADDVLVTLQAKAASERLVTVRCVDAATKAAVPVFFASWQQAPEEQAQFAMLFHLAGRREFRDTAQFAVRDSDWGGLGCIVVDAPGHGFAVVGVPDDLGKPLEVELGPEHFLTGRVVDAETDAPMAGVFVRALPTGTSSGGGTDPRTTGVPTDADGRYRIGGLRPGQYGVQAYAVDRPASRVFRTQVGHAAEATLDLEVPKRRWLEFTLAGDVPPGPRCQITFLRSYSSLSGEVGFANHAVGHSAALAVDRAGHHKLGPVGNGNFRAQLWKPGRVRLGAGTTFDLGEIDGPTTIQLPELRSVLVRGRVRLPGDVATERIAVLAHAVSATVRGAPRFARPEPHVAGLEADGQFTLDLPVGAYALQLADLETGIVFHTEADPREVGPDPKPLELQPAVHWLELELAPTAPGGEVVLQQVAVDVRRPQGKDLGAFLQSWGRSNDVDHGGVPFRAGAVRQRWLVPAGQITLTAQQTFEILRPWADGYRGKPVDSATVYVTEPVHRVRFTVPAPPSDAELLRDAPK